MVSEEGMPAEINQTLYNEEFYQLNVSGMDTNARVLASFILDTVGRENVSSVVDVGCGAGTLLYAFQENGVRKVVGIDGNWAKSKYQLLKEDQFFPVDLRNPDIHFTKTFDLVVSTEVAEHLEAEYAESFLDFLTSLGEMIVFSAAIPGQGGTHHVNEQPQSYWEKIFVSKGFVLLDIIRPKIWQNNLIQTHYKQNLFIYVKKDSTKYQDFLLLNIRPSDNVILDVVHPETFAYYRDPRHFGIRKSAMGLFFGFENLLTRFRKK